MEITFIVVAVLAVVFAALMISIFNKLVQLSNRLKNALAQIEVQLVRRLDLIPNLVNVAKGYMAHERETLTRITEARAGVSQALKNFSQNNTDPAAARALAGAEMQLKEAISGFNISVEAYPDLKASSNMAQLSEELITTENQVSFARQAYNDAVLAYNEYKQSFPAVLFAGIFKHGKDAEVLNFEDRPERNRPVEVQF